MVGGSGIAWRGSERRSDRAQIDALTSSCMPTHRLFGSWMQRIGQDFARSRDRGAMDCASGDTARRGPFILSSTSKTGLYRWVSTPSRLLRPRRRTPRLTSKRRVIGKRSTRSHKINGLNRRHHFEARPDRHETLLVRPPPVLVRRRYCSARDSSRRLVGKWVSAVHRAESGAGNNCCAFSSIRLIRSRVDGDPPPSCRHSQHQRSHPRARWHALSLVGRGPLATQGSPPTTPRASKGVRAFSYAPRPARVS